MTEETVNILKNELSGLLGGENVLRKKSSLVVKPASAPEVAAVMKIAGLAKSGVNAGKYYIGPESFRENNPSSGEIVLSLDRISNILRFDAQSRCLQAGSATPMDHIIKVAAESGLLFPGVACSHKTSTIGESVAACFMDGMPDFKCQSACLCGIELVLFSGQVVNIEGSCTGELGNCDLSYLLSGHLEHPAVVTGIHLKLKKLPLSPPFKKIILHKRKQSNK